MNDSEWIKDTSQFNEHFIKTILNKVMKDNLPENLHNLHNDLSSLPERMKIEKVEKPVANLLDKI